MTSSLTTATSTEPRKFDSGILPVGSSWKYVGSLKGEPTFYTCTLQPEYESYVNRAVSSSSPTLAT